jgi:hypothetical protein
LLPEHLNYFSPGSLRRCADLAPPASPSTTSSTGWPSTASRSRPWWAAWPGRSGCRGASLWCPWASCMRCGAADPLAAVIGEVRSQMGLAMYWAGY